MKKKLRIPTWIWMVILLMAAGHLLFHQLGVQPLRIWDESRLASNAIEMYRDGYSLVTTYDGKPDLWNTKPPLLIWIQTTMLHLFGVSEWSLRLPSALASLGISLMLFLFVYKQTDNSLMALTAALIPVTSEGFLMWHGSRTADYDALLTLFITGSALCIFLYTLYKRSRYLYLFFILISMAVLTKSSAGLMFIPAYFLWIVFSGQLLPILRNKHFWFGLSLMIVLTGGYYLAREIISPGYLMAVNTNELGGRFLEANDGNRGDLWFYPRLLWEARFSYWVYLLLPSIPISLLNPSRANRRVSLFSLTIWISYLLVISISKTKLSWYDLPLYPFFGITIAMSLDTLYRWSRQEKGFISKVLQAAILAGVITILVIPYNTMRKRVDLLEEPSWDQELYHIQYFLREVIDGQRVPDGYAILKDAYWQRNQYYIVLAGLKGIEIPSLYPQDLKPGDKAILYSREQEVYLEKHYHYETIEEFPWETVQGVKILSKKTVAENE